MVVKFTPTGVVPACLVPFDEEGEPDMPAFRAHLRELAGVAGVTGVVVNGHAAEVHALDIDEQRACTAVAAEEIGASMPVICGIYAESTKAACALARAAASDGAHALLVFPPNSLMFGGNQRSELGLLFVEEIAAATDLPLIVFQFPVSTALHYELDPLVELCERVESIAAIKDLCSDPRLHEKHIYSLHGLTRPVNVMTSHSMWLAGSLAMGARGVISGAGSVIPDRQVALFNAVRGNDQSLLSALKQQMHLFVDAFYGHPYVDWQARMKETLYRFGRFATNVVRGPLTPISGSDWNRMSLLFGQLAFNDRRLYDCDI